MSKHERSDVLTNANLAKGGVHSSERQQFIQKYNCLQCLLLNSALYTIASECTVNGKALGSEGI